jgi:hypothetical protein
MGILAVAITVIVASMATAISLATRHREQARAQVILVAAAEAVKVAQYTDCNDEPVTAYDDAASSVSTAGYSAKVDSVAPMDDGCELERVRVTVSSTGGYSIGTDVVKRKP